MPYILRGQREKLNPTLDKLTELAMALPDFNKNRAGILNFIITKIILTMLKAEKKYATINDIIGALECAKLELYRRHVAPYEDIKIKENGDVL